MTTLQKKPQPQPKPASLKKKPPSAASLKLKNGPKPSDHVLEKVKDGVVGKKGSRKGKKEWSKNVDISGIETSLDQIR
ncbi:hypothetical protein HDU67_000281, partial [Dinochytrium kinnereticum]